MPETKLIRPANLSAQNFVDKYCKNGETACYAAVHLTHEIQRQDPKDIVFIHNILICLSEAYPETELIASCYAQDMMNVAAYSERLHNNDIAVSLSLMHQDFPQNREIAAALVHFACRYWNELSEGEPEWNAFESLETIPEFFEEDEQASQIIAEIWGNAPEKIGRENLEKVVGILRNLSERYPKNRTIYFALDECRQELAA